MTISTLSSPYEVAQDEHKYDEAAGVLTTVQALTRVRAIMKPLLKLKVETNEE